MVTQLSPEGRSGYDVDVYINNIWIRKVQNAEGQVVMEITRLLNPGKNMVKLAAIKTRGAPSAPATRGQLSIILGEGVAGGNNVVIDRPIIEYRRQASEDDAFVNEYTLEAR
jgi:hypothetical protein